MNNAKRVLTLTAAGLMALHSFAADTREWPAHAASERSRVVVLTDFPPLDVTMDSGPAHKRSDPDDIQSMVRFLVYANDLDVEGLVASSATFANFANKTNLLDIGCSLARGDLAGALENLRSAGRGNHRARQGL
jgi:hypothetical protein